MQPRIKPKCKQNQFKYNFLLFKCISENKNNSLNSPSDQIIQFSSMKNSEKNLYINKKKILSQFDLVDNFINIKRKKINLINDNKDKINSMIKILSNKIKENAIIIIIIYKLYNLEKIFNNINTKYLKKEFINNLKNLSNSEEQDNSNSNNEVEIVKIKINLKKYVNNNQTIKKHFNDWIDIINKKNILNMLKENKKLMNKNEIIPDSNENNEINNQKNKKKNELLNKIFNIKNKINKNIIRNNFNNWKKIISNNKKTKKRIAKRNGYRKKNKKKNEIIKVKKIIDNIEILRNIMHRWKNNAYNIKINDDYKSILTSFKENSEQSIDNNAIENKNKKINNYDNLNEDLLNRLKKVSLHLILSKYQKIRDLLLKKYFYKWKNNTITNKIKKKNRKLIREISKYIRKKVGFCFKKKENEINNNIKKNNKEKTFAKKKTKLNLYKEKIKHYKNFIQNYPDNNIIRDNFEVSDINTTSENKFIINENTPETNRFNNNIIINQNTPEENKPNNNNNLIITENTPETSKINNNNFIINKISNFTEPRYIIKKPGRRNISQNKIKTRNELLENEIYNINENLYHPHISKSNEKNNDIYKRNTDLINFNSNLENLLTNTEYSSDNPYNNRVNDSKDKIINLIKANSSQEESITNNHISLVEETNEIRKPKNSINLSIKNKKNYFSPDKSYKIKNPRNLLTDNRPKKYLYPQNMRYDNNNFVPYSNEIYIKTKKSPIQYKNITSPFRINDQQTEKNNIYLYGNYDGNKYYKNYINQPKNIYYMKNNEKNYYNNNNNYEKVNPLYERMRKSKMNSNLNAYYSPFEKKFINNKNKVKMIYNQDNGMYNLSESEEFNNLSKYGNETLNNNYNFRNVIY